MERKKQRPLRHDGGVDQRVVDRRATREECDLFEVTKHLARPDGDVGLRSIAVPSGGCWHSRHQSGTGMIQRAEARVLRESGEAWRAAG